MRSEGGGPRGLGAALALLAGIRERRRRRRAERAKQREHEREQERAVAELEATEGPRPGEPMAPEGVLAERAEHAESSHEKIRRRRAEPPPTKARSAESHPGSELIVIAALLGATLAAGGFATFYVAVPDTQLLGLTLGLALAFFAVAAIVAGKRVVPQEKAVEEYHHFGDEEKQADVEAIVTEAGEGVSRRRLIAGACGLAGATLGAAVALPAASLGPNVGERIYASPWKRGRRVVDSAGRAIAAADVPEEGFLTAYPEGASTLELGAPILLLRFPVEELQLARGRDRVVPEGIIAYSKICTHAGCAVSMYRAPKYEPVESKPALVCPCHFSTFDPRAGGEVVFGPAPRALPQLPLRVNAEGILEADGDFLDTIGPSYGGSRLRPPRDVKPEAGGS